MQHTKEQTQQAREYAAQIHYTLAKECFNDDFGFADHVTQQDKEEYSNKQLQLADEIIQGQHDHNFTVWQRMNYYLTGECVALLP